MRAILCSLLLSTILVGLPAADTPSLRLGMTAWIPDAPANVAEVKGFWKAEGIQVEVVNYEQDSELSNSIKARKLHIALSMLGSAITWNGDGLSTCIIAETDWSNGGDKFVLKKGAKMADLKGAPLGVYAEDASVVFFVSKVLGKHGLKLADVELAEIEPEPMTAQLLAGKLTAISSYDPFTANAIAGGATLVASTADFPGCMPEGLIGNRELLANLPPGTLVKFLRGWSKAVAWSLDPANFQEFCAIVRDKTYSTNTEKPDSDAVKALLAGVKLHDPKMLAERNRDGVSAWLTEIHDFLKSNNRLKVDFDPKTMFDPKPIAEALAP